MVTVNATGKECPQPVIMTKAALEKGTNEIEVLVDNPVAATNVRRLLENKGFQVELQDDEGTLRLIGKLSGSVPAAAAPAAAPSASQVPGNSTFAVLITGKTLGKNDEELGEVLIKSFLGTLSKLDTPPTTLALMNEGVKLALFDSSTCDHLKDLQARHRCLD